MFLRTMIVLIALFQWACLILRLNGIIETNNWMLAWFHPLFCTALVVLIWIVDALDRRMS